MPRPSKKVFGKLLKQHRKQHFLGTQGQIADKVGVNEKRVGAIEQSEVAGIDEMSVPDWAKAYRMDVPTFLAKFEVPPDHPLLKKTVSPEELKAAMDEARALLDAGQADEAMRIMKRLPGVRPGSIAARRGDKK